MGCALALIDQLHIEAHSMAHGQHLKLQPHYVVFVLDSQGWNTQHPEGQDLDHPRHGE
jgi:hypothetical protein